MSAALFGRDAESAARRVGSLAQLARIDRFVENDGPALGARRLRMVTGGGLEVDIHPERALDLGQVTFNGIPLAWMSAVGIASPATASSRGTDWLRSFGGGMLATCGLDTFGPPSEDDGVEYPMHGRVGVIPASVEVVQVGQSSLVVEGTVRQARVFGENLLLRRRWSADIGSSTLRLADTVTNAGASDTSHMILYHVNLGWPLLDEDARLSIVSTRSWPRDDAAAAAADRVELIEPPQRGFAEQVFGHDFTGLEAASARIENQRLGIGFELRFDAATLPGLHQWKMFGEHEYALGLEPTNVNSFAGRSGTREAGLLPILAPGESVAYSIELAFSTLPTTPESA